MSEQNATADWEFPNLTPPTGFEITPDLRDAVKTIAVKHGISSAGVQELAQLHFDMTNNLLKNYSEIDKAVKEWTAKAGKWEEELNAKYGSKENVEKIAAKIAPVIDRFGGDSLRAVLNESGLGNNPVMFQFFEKLAAAFGEGTVVGAGGKPGPANPYELLYKNSSEMFRK